MNRKSNNRFLYHYFLYFIYLSLTNMNIEGKNYRTIWFHEEKAEIICIIDQRYLLRQFIIEHLHSVKEVARAIKGMHVRGAGLIRAAAG